MMTHHLNGPRVPVPLGGVTSQCHLVWTDDDQALKTRLDDGSWQMPMWMAELKSRPASFLGTM